MWAIPISILIAILIGLIGEALAEGESRGGAAGSITAGLTGAWLGSWLFKDLGPVIDGFAIIPAIVGASLLVFVVAAASRLLARSL